MTSLIKIKQIVEKETGKSIGINALKKIENYLEKEIIKLIKSAARNADFSGRKTIKEEDLMIG